MKPRLITRFLATAVILAVATGCGANSSYQKRMDYLRVVAQRGADTHALIAAQGASIDKKRCEAAFDGLAGGDEPSMTDGGDYHDQVKEFFVDSCISGLPKPVPGSVPSQPASGTPVPSSS